MYNSSFKCKCLEIAGFKKWQISAVCCILQVFVPKRNKKITFLILIRKTISKFTHTDVIMEQMFIDIGVLTGDLKYYVYVE